MSKKVGQVIVEALAAAGVKHCYGVVGDTLNTIANSIRNSSIEFVQMRHEEAGAFAAQGEALFGSLGDAPETAETKPLFDAMRNVFGFVPNLGYALAVEPPVLSAYLVLLQSLGATSLEPVAQQVALAAASKANAADYGVAVHATLAGKLGASAEVVDALRRGIALTDPKDGKPTRVGFTFIGKGDARKKVRVARRSGAEIDG